MRLNPTLPNSNVCELNQSAIKTSFHQAIIAYNCTIYMKLSLFFSQKIKIVKFLIPPQKLSFGLVCTPKYTELYLELYSA